MMKFNDADFMSEFDSMSGMSSHMSVFMIIFAIIFISVFAVIIVVIVKSVLQWNKNNKSPRLTVPAMGVSKRMDVRRHHTGSNNMNTHNVTTYYVTFQVQSGDRMELYVSGQDYGMLAEGDNGNLTFQGTRYLGFERFY